MIPAIEAVNWNPFLHDCDVRPRLLDKSTGQFRLLDTGSQITAVKRTPEDKLDTSVRLIAVNGSKIDTYGTKVIKVKIGRKTYEMPAVVCDISQDILGADFVNRYKLGFEWDDFNQTELYIVDKKAQIKEELQIVTVAPETQRVAYLDSGGSEPVTRNAPSNEAIAFQVACMNALEVSEVKEETGEESIEDQLKLHDPEYVELLKAYPALLKPTFTKGEPAHGVYHYINTGSHAPCK